MHHMVHTAVHRPPQKLCWLKLVAVGFIRPESVRVFKNSRGNLQVSSLKLP